MRLRRRSIVWLVLLGTGFVAPPLVAVYLMLGEQGNLPSWLTPPEHFFPLFRPSGSAGTPPGMNAPAGRDGAAASAAPPA